MEKEIARLIRVLRQISHDAGYALLCDGEDTVLLHCIKQYNQVHQRLCTMIPKLEQFFQPLAEQTSAGTVRLQSRDLAYYLVTNMPRSPQSDTFIESNFVAACCFGWWSLFQPSS